MNSLKTTDPTAPVQNPTPTTAPAPTTTKVAFRGEEAPQDAFVKEAKGAKNAGIIASVAGIGSIAVSTVMLMKANKVAKAAQPVIEDLQKQLAGSKKIMTAVEKFAKDTGLDNVSELISTVVNKLFGHSGDAVKNLGEIAKKMNIEADEVKLAELQKQFSEKLAQHVEELAKDVDKTAAPTIKKIVESPLSSILEAMGNGKAKMELPKESLTKLMKMLDGDSEIAKDPVIKAFIDRNFVEEVAEEVV